MLDLLKDYGLDRVLPELSTRPEKSVGSEEIWDEATDPPGGPTASGSRRGARPWRGGVLRPKISVQARDAIGRTWQMSTIPPSSTCPSGSKSSTPAPTARDGPG